MGIRNHPQPEGGKVICLFPLFFALRFGGRNFWTVFSMDLGRQDFPRSGAWLQRWSVGSLTGQLGRASNQSLVGAPNRKPQKPKTTTGSEVSLPLEPWLGCLKPSLSQLGKGIAWIFVHLRGSRGFVFIKKISLDINSLPEFLDLRHFSGLGHVVSKKFGRLLAHPLRK